MREFLLEVGQKAVEHALRAGADEAEAYVASGTSAEAIFEEKISSFRISSRTGLGIRAVVGRKIGMFSTSSLEPSDMAGAAEMAVKIARASGEDRWWRSLPEELSSSHVEGIFDEETASLEPELITSCISRAVEGVLEVGRNVRPTRGLLRVSRSQVAICNSSGGGVSRAGTAVMGWVRATAEEAGRKATGSEVVFSRALSTIDFEALGREAGKRSLDFLRARRLPTQKMDVVVRGLVMAGLVSTMFGRTLTAEAVQEKRSPWAGRLGETVASEAFTLVDDGTLRKGFRSRPFDDEGIRTQRTPLIEHGVLKAFLYDDYRAKREGVRSTGNAWRARPGARPRPAPNCLVLKPGDWALEELLADTGRGLYVVETIGEWLSDPVRGFLNATITHGYLIEGGELGQPVSGVAMSCDFFTAMREQMDAFCRELEDYMGCYAPATRIRGVNISGG
mgnify:CR=1 FL=1